jgi:hypothetical protein
MEQVTFLIEHKKDKKVLIAIAEKLGIKKYSVSKSTDVVRKSNREDLFKIIDAGVDVSNFGDPSLWQKETRKDRNLNQLYR